MKTQVQRSFKHLAAKLFEIIAAIVAEKSPGDGLKTNWWVLLNLSTGARLDTCCMTVCSHLANAKHDNVDLKPKWKGELSIGTAIADGSWSTGFTALTS